MKYTIGIDIGGTNTVIGFVNEEGKIISQKSISTKGNPEANVFVTKLYKLVEADIDKFGKDNIKGVGVGAPNGNIHSGTIEYAMNLEWYGVVPFAKFVEEIFGLKCKVTNDANAAAIGEMMYGNARGMKDFIEITLGTGVGSGFVANGQVIYGHDGFAGELGHTIAVRNGRQCNCGRLGCLETYTSATGILRTVEEFTKKYPESILNKIEKISSKDIHEAAINGDKAAIEIFDYTGKILGQSLADAIAITSPEAIIIFGGLAKAGQYIFEPTKKYMEMNLLKNFQNKVKILPSALPESDVAILGAAALMN